MSEVICKTGTIQQIFHLDDSINFLLSAYNALYKYHNVVINDTELITIGAGEMVYLICTTRS